MWCGLEQKYHLWSPKLISHPGFNFFPKKEPSNSSITLPDWKVYASGHGIFQVFGVMHKPLIGPNVLWTISKGSDFCWKMSQNWGQKDILWPIWKPPLNDRKLKHRPIPRVWTWPFTNCPGKPTARFWPSNHEPILFYKKWSFFKSELPYETMPCTKTPNEQHQTHHGTSGFSTLVASEMKDSMAVLAWAMIETWNLHDQNFSTKTSWYMT